jgi:hypothetical protein
MALILRPKLVKAKWHLRFHKKFTKIQKIGAKDGAHHKPLKTIGVKQPFSRGLRNLAA